MSGVDTAVSTDSNNKQGQDQDMTYASRRSQVSCSSLYWRRPSTLQWRHTALDVLQKHCNTNTQHQLLSLCLYCYCTWSISLLFLSPLSDWFFLLGFYRQKQAWSCTNISLVIWPKIRSQNYSLFSISAQHPVCDINPCHNICCDGKWTLQWGSLHKVPIHTVHTALQQLTTGSGDTAPMQTKFLLVINSRI